jgi:nitrate/nitrite-specific signal transduction histidine kinase
MSLSQAPFPADSSGQAQREVRLMIRDDGVGFASGEKQSFHLGTSIMHERAAAIQASLSLESQPGHGTQVTLTWCSQTEDLRSVQ